MAGQLDTATMMEDGVIRVVEGARSAVGVLEAAVRLAVESEAGAPDDPVHEALGGLFSQIHELLAHLPGRQDDPSAESAGGLMSELAVRARLEEEVARARRYGGTLSILLI